MSILEWPDVLRNAGLQVFERAGWRTNQPLGPLKGLRVIYWHHDASAAGPSMGAWGWICNSYDTKQPSAQLWMDMSGKWYFCGSGVAYHAGTGRVPGDWNTTVGLETDHTNNEIYPPVMLNSIQRGFAAIAKHERRNADLITFHKIEAVPRGRKVDPYLRTDNGNANDQSTWDRELAEQRAIIQRYIDGGTPPPSQDWFDMATEADLRRIVKEELSSAQVTGEVHTMTLNELIEGQPYNKTAANFNDVRGTGGRYSVVVDDATGAWYAVAPGFFWHIPSSDYVDIGRRAGLFAEFDHHLDTASIDIVRNSALSGPTEVVK